jgi:DNA-binding NarL/FixJ family response regulator
MREGCGILGTREVTAEGLTAIVFDRYPIVLEVLVGFLRDLDIDVQGATTSPKHALALIESHTPDIFLAGLDERPASVDTVDLVREAAKASSDLKVLVLGNGKDRIEECFAAGVSAYITNAASPDDFAVAIRQTYEPSIHLATNRRDEPVPVAAGAGGLTEREIEVVALVAEGYSNAELARRLWVTPQTVKFHLSNIYRKLDVSNRTQAGLWARQARLKVPDDESVAQAR